MFLHWTGALLLSLFGVFCSEEEEEDLLPSDTILGGRADITRAVPASGSGLRAFRQWQPSETATRHGGAKRGLLRVKSL